MFPQTFKRDAKIYISNHNAIQFKTELSKTKLIAMVKKMGIAAFAQPEDTNPYSMKPYKDYRITGKPTYQTNAGCCSFSKNRSYWYFYPFHRTELENVGIVEDDLIRYVKFLNDLRVGFKYLYLGEQPSNDMANTAWRIGNAHNNSARYPNNLYYWVAVPSFTDDEAIHGGIPYLHWIYLRYLISSEESTNSALSGKYRVPFYFIPRTLFYMIDVLGLKPFRAFMYSAVAAAWYSGHGMCYADYIGHSLIPDIGITAVQFKAIWHAQTNDGSMNNMLTSVNNNNYRLSEVKKLFQPKHDPTKCWELFIKDGNIKSIVEYLDSVYYPKKVIVPKAKKEGTPKTIRSVTKKAKTKATASK